MPDDDHAPTPDEGDEEERDVQAMADGLREGLKDPSTRQHLRRLAEAAMGDEPDDGRGDTADAETPASPP